MTNEMANGGHGGGLVIARRRAVVLHACVCVCLRRAFGDSDDGGGDLLLCVSTIPAPAAALARTLPAPERRLRSMLNRAS